MLTFVGRRLLAAVPLLLLVTFMVFVMIDLTPGDPALQLAGESATPERVAQVRKELRLDDPLLTRYGRWVGGVVHGDFGTSLSRAGIPVKGLLGEKVWVTASLIFLTMGLATAMALVLGIAAAWHAGRWPDRLISTVSAVGIATPPFWLALVLVVVFAIHLHWLPSLGYVGFSQSPIDWLRGLILPSVALAMVPASDLTLQLRGALIDAMNKDYVTSAEAKGLSRLSVIGKHALKNAALPVVTVLGSRVAQLVGGAVVIEQVFSLRGLGTLAIESAFTHDMSVLLGIIVITTLSVIIINMLVDISYGYFNPRVRT